MVQQLKALVLGETLRWNPSTQLVDRHHLYLWFQGIQCPLLTFKGMCVVHIHACRQNTHNKIHLKFSKLWNRRYMIVSIKRQL